MMTSAHFLIISRGWTIGEASRCQHSAVRAVNRPLPTKEACAIVTALFERLCVVLVETGEQFWISFNTSSLRRV